MGQQSNKVIKRRRRKAYVTRKKALAKQGITRRASSRTAKVSEADADPKKAVKAKSPAAKKAAKPAVKKIAKTPEEIPAIEPAAPAPVAPPPPEAPATE